MSSLLATQPHNYAGELHDSEGAVPYYVVRAEREMRERMAVRLNMARLAAAASVSERTLHDGFRRFRATTPMGRLTALRLAAARRRLLDGEAGVTVGRVVRQSDFFSSADLPGAYRKAFGELPSATLRAARRRKS